MCGRPGQYRWLTVISRLLELSNLSSSITFQLILQVPRLMNQNNLIVGSSYEGFVGTGLTLMKTQSLVTLLRKRKCLEGVHPRIDCPVFSVPSCMTDSKMAWHHLVATSEVFRQSAAKLSLSLQATATFFCPLSFFACGGGRRASMRENDAAPDDPASGAATLRVTSVPLPS